MSSAFGQARDDVTVRVCYCSVLDECWVATERPDEPTRVARCDEARKRPQYN